ncbi:hypothetical protein BD408DRAFT_412123 [Parasitella parasitica]|nr:hypothetical protein BD408DRAFT_412123 [Parasitella parasitica]
MMFKKIQLECYVAGSTIINPPASFLKPSSVQISKEKADYWSANDFKTMSRDQVSAFAIRLAGLENRYWARLSMEAILFEG